MKKLLYLFWIPPLLLALGFAREPRSSSSTPTAEPSLEARLPSNKTVYTALGDSITFGLWSTKPCDAKVPQNLSIHCQDGTSFPDRVSQALAKDGEVTEQNLGISGAVINDVIVSELPNVQEEPNLITFYIGTNDLYRIEIGIDAEGHSIPNDSEDLKEKAFDAFETSYRNFVAELRKDYPSAKIVILNLPESAANPLAKRLNTEVINPLTKDGFIVIDLASDPESYDPAMYASGPHPNDRGYQHIADKIIAGIE